MNKRVKKKNSKLRSYNPVNVMTEVNGNRNTNSMSYNKKKIQINKNWIGIRTGFCVIGRNPHS